MNSNLDVFAIQNNKEEIFNAIKNVNKESNGNILYVNCICRLKIGDVKIKNRRFDSCFYSEDSDVIIFFARDKISREEIEKILGDNGIKYTVISFIPHIDDFEDTAGDMDIVFARDKLALENAIDDSLKKKIDMCLYYPKEKSFMYMGYRNKKNRFVEIDGRVCQGTIVFKDKLVLLISQKDPRNLNSNDALKILKDKGITVIERGNVSRR